MSSQLSFCSLEDAWNYKPPVKVAGFNATLPHNDKHKHMDANTLYSQFDDMPHFEKQKFMNIIKNTYQSTNSYEGPHSKVKKTKTQPVQNKTNELKEAKKIIHKDANNNTDKNDFFGIDQDTFHFVLLFLVGILMYYSME